MKSISDREDYKSVCVSAYNDDNVFNIFKKKPAYNAILEHVTQEQGRLYLDNIESNLYEFKNFIDRFKKNDLYGGSNLVNYDEYGYISPSTLRYVKVLSDLKSIFGDLNGKKIIEIGVGYGGQCCVLQQMFDIDQYTLVDMDEVLMLSDKYLNKLGVKHDLMYIDDVYNNICEYDIVISNYAYSELNKELQDLYYDNIISKSKNGYFTMNFISDIFGIDSYNESELNDKFSNKNINYLDETPKTFEKNIIIYF